MYNIILYICLKSDNGTTLKNNNNYINIFSLTSSGLSMMKELDKAMSTDNMWRTIKVYLDVWNEYTILVNKQLVNSKCKYHL